MRELYIYNKTCSIMVYVTTKVLNSFSDDLFMLTNIKN